METWRFIGSGREVLRIRWGPPGEDGMIQGILSAAICFLLSGQAGPPAAPPSPTGISLEEYRSRREKVQEAIGKDALFVLQAGKETEGVAGFRQESNFFYLTGVEEPGLVLMLDPEGPEEEVLFLPKRSPRHERWNGPRLFPGEEAEAATGIGATRPISEYQDYLSARVAQKDVIYYNYKRIATKDAIPTDLEAILRLQVRGGPGHGEEAIRLAHPRTILTGMRQVKSEAEIGLLRQAVAVTCTGLREAIRSVRPGMYEYQLQAVLEYVFKRDGAERSGFSSIIGSGPNTCVLHYRQNRRQMAEGDLVVADVGAEYGRYTADVTRTFPVSGKFTSRQREIYEIVLEAQRQAFEMVRPGSTMGAIHGKAREVIQEAGYGKYFLHGTSHWLGLDVHDVGQRGRKLEPGMVLTVEPGIYIPAEEIGIRIEDDLLVTEEGYLQLTAPLARKPDEIERIIAEKGLAEEPDGPGSSQVR